MDTFTLRYFLCKLVCKNRIRKTWVVAKNEIDEVDFNSYPFAVIINTEPSSVHTIGHWTCLIRLSAKKPSLFFESYGGTPLDYNLHFPSTVSKNLLNISRAFQGAKSLVCGLYCLELIILISRGYSYKYFLALFNVNTKVINDKKTIRFFRKINTGCVRRGGQFCSSKVRNVNSHR